MMFFQNGILCLSSTFQSCVHFVLFIYFLSFFKLFHLPESIIQKVDHLNANAFVRLSSVERKNNKIAMICIHTSKGVLYKVCTGRLLPKVQPLFLLWPYCQHRYLFHKPLFEKGTPFVCLFFFYCQHRYLFHIPLLEKKVPLFFVCFFFFQKKFKICYHNHQFPYHLEDTSSCELKSLPFYKPEIGIPFGWGLPILAIIGSIPQAILPLLLHSYEPARHPCFFTTQ